MPHREPADLMPASAWVNLADLDRMATAAADRAVAGVAVKQGDVEKIVEHGVEEGIHYLHYDEKDEDDIDEDI